MQSIIIICIHNTYMYYISCASLPASTYVGNICVWFSFLLWSQISEEFLLLWFEWRKKCSSLAQGLTTNLFLDVTSPLFSQNLRNGRTIFIYFFHPKISFSCQKNSFFFTLSNFIIWWLFQFNTTVKNQYTQNEK